MTTQIKKIIAEMRKKEKAASEGKWEVRPSSDNRPYIFQSNKDNDLGPLVKTYRHNIPGHANAEFIVLARNNITAILDYIKKLEIENEELKKTIIISFENGNTLEGK